MSRRPHLRWLWGLALFAGLVLAVLLPTAAWAQDSNYPPSTTVTTRNQCEGTNGVNVCGTSVTVSRNNANPLPFTGGDVALLTVLGLGAAAGGLGLVWVARRSSSTA
jgi:hypothetical protein